MPPAGMCHHSHTPVSLPPCSEQSPAWPVIRPHSPGPSQPGPRDLCPCVPSSCVPTALGPSRARPCSRHGQSMPVHRAAQVPALGAPPTVLRSWDLPGSLAEPSSRHGHTCSWSSGRDQDHPIPCQRQLHSLGSGRKCSSKLEKHQLISEGNNSLSTGDKDSDLYMWCSVFSIINI